MPQNTGGTDDPFPDFDVISEFPFPVVAFSRLRRHLRTVYEFLPHASAQEQLRLQARIDAQEDPISRGEMEGELDTLKLDETTLLPHLVWGGVLVSVYAAFEFGLKEVLLHWQRLAKHPIPFEQQSRKDFVTSAEAYAMTYIGVGVFANTSERDRLTELRQLRNSFAHEGSRMSKLPRKLAIAIERKRHLGVSLDIVDGQWIANARCAAFFLLCAERVTRSFSDSILGKCLERRIS